MLQPQLIDWGLSSCYKLGLVEQHRCDLLEARFLHVMAHLLADLYAITERENEAYKAYGKINTEV